MSSLFILDYYIQKWRKFHCYLLIWKRGGKVNSKLGFTRFLHYRKLKKYTLPYTSIVIRITGPRKIFDLLDRPLKPLCLQKKNY